MNSAGLLTVRATLRQGRLTDLAVDLRRPAVTQLFVGQSPQAVLQRVPHLYTLCAHAQRAAAQAALDAAQAAPAHSVNPTELWTESLHENLWRLLLDWPPALGLPAAKEAFVTWRASRSRSDLAAQTQLLLDGVLHDLSAQCLEHLARKPQSDTYAELSLDPAPWLALCQQDAAATPLLRAPSSVRAAYLARIAQVRAAALALAEHTPYPLAAMGGKGWGVAQTLTARGVLTHAALVEQSCVLAYRVWAPTDAFFANPLALQALLEPGPFASAQQARRAVELGVLALDPCVPFVVELPDA